MQKSRLKNKTASVYFEKINFLDLVQVQNQ